MSNPAACGWCGAGFLCRLRSCGGLLRCYCDERTWTDRARQVLAQRGWCADPDGHETPERR